MAEQQVYEAIARNIKTGHCVLLLGPELSVNQEGKGYRSYFKGLSDEDCVYFSDDNLFHFKSSIRARSAINDIMSFYEGVGDPVLLEMIARIKFPLVINVCPDNALGKVYEQKAIAHEYGYFSSSHLDNNYDTQEENERLKPSLSKPVVYNIFGSVDDRLSMVLDHRGLYRRIEQILPSDSLPLSIESHLKNASGFIFLGFRFDSWYYQLLCHKLKLVKDREEANYLVTTLSTSIHGKPKFNILQDHFGMIFTPQNPTQSIDKIISQCQSTAPDVLRNDLNNDSFSVFLSYAWGDENLVDRETIVHQIQKYVSENNLSIQLIKDKDVLTFGDSIDSFMTRIGKGKSIIRVVSDKYLRSRYCMTEAIRMSNFESEEKRIFTINWGDVQDLTVYKEFWISQSRNIFNDIDNKKIDWHDKQRLKANNQIYLDIYDFLDDFHFQIQDQIDLRISENDFEAKDDEIELTTESMPRLESFMAAIVDTLNT